MWLAIHINQAPTVSFFLMQFHLSCSYKLNKPKYTRTQNKMANTHACTRHHKVGKLKMMVWIISGYKTHDAKSNVGTSYTSTITIILRWHVCVCSSDHSRRRFKLPIVTTALPYDPSNFFHLAYAKISKKSNTQAADVIQTKGQNTPSMWYKLQGMFIPNAPAIIVSIAIANDAIVNVNCSWISSFRWLSSWMLT